MAEHNLKLDTHYFDAVRSGQKSFEVRRDDRGFQRGDTLKLHRYGSLRHNQRQGYLSHAAAILLSDKSDAETILCTIEYVLTGGQFGIEPGYVVLAISVLTPSDTKGGV